MSIELTQRVCDKCFHLEIHPSGVIEKCHKMFFDLTEKYVDNRMNGNATYCREFKKLPSLKKNSK